MIELEISSIIKCCVSLCFMLCIFFVSSSNGTREAYVEYDEVKSVYSLTLDKPKTWVAHGIFSNEINATGWSKLFVKTNKTYNDRVQAYSAGFVEGYLTQTLIKYNWRNSDLDVFCQPPFTSDCAKLHDFLKTNIEWLKKQVLLNAHNNDYWHQIELIMIQNNAMLNGYHNTPEQPSLEIDPFNLWLFQVMGDLDAISRSLNVTLFSENVWQDKVIGSGSCSALIKLLPDLSDVFVSQVTWNHFSSMLRILKKYDFGYHDTQGSIIHGHAMSFSSYPGYLFSLDDFYILSSNMVTQETTIGNSADDRWKYVHAATVPEAVRVMVSNRLTSSGSQWASVFSKHNSGTYNNEWMVVDYKRFNRGSHNPLQAGFFTLLNQIPGYVEYSDLTSQLLNHTYHASYNVPYFPTVYKLSGWPKLAEIYGDFFTYNHSPRANIFRRDHIKVKDRTSMIKLMRYNDYKHDPLALCNCTPPYSGENAIAARSDLNPANGTYVLPVFGHRLHGATDVKVTSYNLAKQLEFFAQAGPTHDQQPPFQWSKLQLDTAVRHEGMPDLFTFETVHVKWD